MFLAHLHPCIHKCIAYPMSGCLQSSRKPLHRRWVISLPHLFIRCNKEDEDDEAPPHLKHRHRWLNVINKTIYQSAHKNQYETKLKVFRRPCHRSHYCMNNPNALLFIPRHDSKSISYKRQPCRFSRKKPLPTRRRRRKFSLWIWVKRAVGQGRCLPLAKIFPVTCAFIKIACIF